MEAPPRTRRRWLWLLGLALLGLGAWLGLRALLQPARLSAFLLQQAERATGLSFELERPAEVSFWPDLHLVLHGLAVHAPDSEVAILRGQRIEIGLPWSALRGEDVRLRELRLVPMALDLQALQQWLEARASLGPPAPLRLPQLDAGLLVTRSRVSYGDWALADLNLHLNGLRDGEMSTAALSGIVSAASTSIPFRMSLVFVPLQRGAEIRLEPLAVALRDAPDSDPWLQAEGSLSLEHPRNLQVELAAVLPRWPVDWPALPLPAASETPAVQLRLAFSGTPQLQGGLDLQLSRAGQQVDASLQLEQLPAWLGDPRRSLLPPLRGTVTAPLLQAGGAQLRGVRLRIDEVLPAEQDAQGAGGGDDP